MTDMSGRRAASGGVLSYWVAWLLMGCEVTRLMTSCEVTRLRGFGVASFVRLVGQQPRNHATSQPRSAKQPRNLATTQPRNHGSRSNLATSQPALALLAVLALSHCGYALVGHSNFLNPTIKTVQVPAFINRTTRVELEQRVTQAVADEMVARGRLKLVTQPSQADVILRGSIDSFGLFAIAYNAQGRATQYQVSVTAKIELLDHRNDDKVLWKNDQYRFTENYQVNVQSTDAFDQETRATREIAGRFAETLVTNLLEGF